MAKIYIAQTKHNGKGIFTDSNIKKDEIIMEFKGNLINYKETKKYRYFEDHCLQIDENLYIGPDGKEDDFINHSCNPNYFVKINDKRAFLIGLKNISKGEEITYDYSTTLDEDDWEMDCNCKESICRKRVRDFKYLPKKLQQKYIKLNIIPDFITKTTKCNHHQ